MSKNIYACTPRQVKQFTLECLMAGLVPFIQSSPGLGKSSIVKQIAKDMNWKLIDHRLSTSEPTDLTGLPFFENGKAKFMPFNELFPTDDMEVPNGYNGWLIFLDEFNSASKAVQAASYKLILDRMIGQHKLHENVLIIAAGNLTDDKAITTSLSTAMQSRVIHLEMQPSYNEWLEDVAIPQNYDSRIIAFLSMFPSKLMDFNPEHNEKTFCCPRTWEFTNKLIQQKTEISDSYANLLSGTITSGVAVEFIQFTKVYKNLVTVKEIIKSPDDCKIPSDNPTKWATISHMIEKITVDNFDPLATYANRFDVTFRILFFRSIIIKQPKLIKHPVFSSAMISLQKYLHD